MHTVLIASECKQATLLKNSDGEILQTLSGDIFETFSLHRITAILWLPMSELLICTLDRSYRSEEYEILNTDSGEKINAFALKKQGSRNRLTNGCYNSSIRKPTPFMGNNGEVFVLSDGSVWEIKYEYNYMYKYYPRVVACPDDGYIVVDGKKLRAQILR